MEKAGQLAETGNLVDVAGQYLTFSLADEFYGVEILTVQEINGLLPITPVPRTPEYIKGVINLRGKISPVIDLRLKLGVEAREYTKKTCIIVVNLVRDGQPLAVGVIVDSVQEVCDFALEQLEPTPNFGGGDEAQFIRAMGKLENQVVMLLDISKALQDTDFSSLAKESSEAVAAPLAS